MCVFVKVFVKGVRQCGRRGVSKGVRKDVRKGFSEGVRKGVNS